MLDENDQTSATHRPTMCDTDFKARQNPGALEELLLKRAQWEEAGIEILSQPHFLHLLAFEAGEKDNSK